ncbi:hypothetical protein GE061_020012 [Apolygus lucorum]|uniref:PHD finger protein 10 n=1 Tax=Apolygus lucorum TaxID=248454 RepID=A0A8S9XC37_APOLU|nr:hypothetical protein GE061_020012 [Apolygus lucorum]
MFLELDPWDPDEVGAISVSSYFRLFEDVTGTLDQQKQVRLLRSKVRGTAKQFMIDNMGSYEGENPYLHMKQAMVQWYERDNPGKAAASLWTLKKQPNETLRQFAEKVRQLAQVAVQEEGAELNAAQKVQWVRRKVLKAFVRGVGLELGSHLLSTEPTTIEAALKRAEELEETLGERDEVEVRWDLSAVQQGERKCYACGAFGHFAARCTSRGTNGYLSGMEMVDDDFPSEEIEVESPDGATERTSGTTLKTQSTTSELDSDDSLYNYRRKSRRQKVSSSFSSSDDSIVAQPHRRKKCRVSSLSSDSDDSLLARPSRKKCKVLSESESESTDTSDSEEDKSLRRRNDRRPNRHAVSSSEATPEKGSPKTKNTVSVDLNSSDSDEGEKCIICFKSLKPPFAHPSNCNHNFHPTCLATWTKTSNTCPIDRVVYKAILVVDQQGHLISEEKVNTPPPQDHNADFEVDDATFCEVCSQHDREHEMLLCDRCEAGYHLDCLTPPLREVPDGNWFCPRCDDLGNELAAEMNELMDDAAIILETRMRQRSSTSTRMPSRPRTRGAQRVFNIIHHQQTSDQPSTSSVTIRRHRTSSHRTRRSKSSRRPQGTRYKVELITVEDGTTLEVKVAVNTRTRTKSKKHSRRKSKKKCSKGSHKSGGQTTSRDTGFTGEGPSHALDLFGSRPQLDYFSGCEAEDELDEDGGRGGGVGVLQLGSRPGGVRNMASRKQIAAQILNARPRRPPPRIEVSRAPVDLVSSIIEQQEKWHSPGASYQSTSSGDIRVIMKDGSSKTRQAGGSGGSSSGNPPRSSETSSSSSQPPRDSSGGSGDRARDTSESAASSSTRDVGEDLSKSSGSSEKIPSSDVNRDDNDSDSDSRGKVTRREEDSKNPSPSSLKVAERNVSEECHASDEPSSASRNFPPADSSVAFNKLKCQLRNDSEDSDNEYKTPPGDSPNSNEDTMGDQRVPEDLSMKKPVDDRDSKDGSDVDKDNYVAAEESVETRMDKVESGNDGGVNEHDRHEKQQNIVDEPEDLSKVNDAPRSAQEYDRDAEVIGGRESEGTLDQCNTNSSAKLDPLEVTEESDDVKKEVISEETDKKESEEKVTFVTECSSVQKIDATEEEAAENIDELGDQRERAPSNTEVETEGDGRDDELNEPRKTHDDRTTESKIPDNSTPSVSRVGDDETVKCTNNFATVEDSGKMFEGESEDELIRRDFRENCLLRDAIVTEPYSNQQNKGVPSLSNDNQETISEYESLESRAGVDDHETEREEHSLPSNASFDERSRDDADANGRSDEGFSLPKPSDDNLEAISEYDSLESKAGVDDHETERGGHSLPSDASLDESRSKLDADANGRSDEGLSKPSDDNQEAISDYETLESKVEVDDQETEREESSLPSDAILHEPRSRDVENDGTDEGLRSGSPRNDNQEVIPQYDLERVKLDEVDQETAGKRQDEVESSAKIANLENEPETQAEQGGDLLEIGCEEEKDGLVDITDDEISSYERSWEMEENGEKSKKEGLEGLDTEAISDCEYQPVDTESAQKREVEESAEFHPSKEGIDEEEEEEGSRDREEEGEIVTEEGSPMQRKKIPKERNYRGDGKTKDKNKGSAQNNDKQLELERYDARRVITEKPQKKAGDFGQDISSDSGSTSLSSSIGRSISRDKLSRSKSRSKSRGRKERLRDRARDRSREHSKSRSRERNKVRSISREKNRRNRSRDKESRSRSRKRRRSRTPRRDRGRSRDRGSRDRKKRKKSQSSSCSSCSCSSCEREKKRNKKLTVVVPNEGKARNRSRDRGKNKKDKRRSRSRNRKRRTPVPSKEVFTSGNNILVSVNFKSSNAEEAVRTEAAPTNKRKKDDEGRKKKDKRTKENQPLRSIVTRKNPGRKKLNTSHMKPVAIIDLDASPFRETTLSPKEVIILTDSDDESKLAKTDSAMQLSGPKTPPEPHIKFSIVSNSKQQQQLRGIPNPLVDKTGREDDDDVMHIGPNTPPEPSVPYDPFEPTKSRSPSPGQTRSDRMPSPLQDAKQRPTPLQSSSLTPPKLSQHDSPKTPSPLQSKPKEIDDMSEKNKQLPFQPAGMGSDDDSGAGGGGDSPYSPGSSEGDDLFEPPMAQSASVPKPRPRPLPATQTNKSKVPQSKATISIQKRSSNLKDTTKKGPVKKDIGMKLDEDQLKILDDLPNSAVEMQFLKKLNRQERVVEEVKLVLKPHYAKKHVSKEEYKEILRRSVPKICHSRSGEINPLKIQRLIEAYVKKYRHRMKRKGGAPVIPPLRQNKPVVVKTQWA